MQDLSGLNRYIGLLLVMCFLALLYCGALVSRLVAALRDFHDDYRKVNSLDEREEAEAQF